MKQIFRSLAVVPALAVAIALAPPLARAQQSLTWEQVKANFETANPTLRADAINVEEMKAQEITAFSRPNPQVGLSSDCLQIDYWTVQLAYLRLVGSYLTATGQLNLAVGREVIQ